MKKTYRFLSMILLCVSSIFIFAACGDDESTTESMPEYNTVTFITNGGTSIADKSCDVIEVSPTTIREYYNFQGWYYDSLFTRAVVFPLSVDNDMTLYAKWEKTKEKLISDCMLYIDNSVDGKLVSQEDNSVENLVDVANTTVTHIGNTFCFGWERGYGSLSEYNNLYISEYDLDITFEYGNLESATGYFSYSYEFYSSDNTLWSGLNASFRIVSIQKTGDTYLLNGYFSSFNIVKNCDFTEDYVESSLQTNLTLALYDFQFLFPVEYWDTIFDYS